MDRNKLFSEVFAKVFKYFSLTYGLIVLGIVFAAIAWGYFQPKNEIVLLVDQIKPSIASSYIRGDIAGLQLKLDDWAKGSAISGMFYDADSNLVWRGNGQEIEGKFGEIFSVNHSSHIRVGEMPIGRIEIHKSYFKTIKIVGVLISCALLGFLSSMLLHQFLLRKTLREAMVPLIALDKKIQKNALDNGFTLSPKTDNEILDLEKWFVELSSAWKSEAEKARETAASEGMIAIAKQVSHDIRSPLLALEMISRSLSGVDEESRVILRNSINRIRDIANSLLAKEAVPVRDRPLNKMVEKSGIKYEPNLTVQLLSPVIDSIVTEKRIQFRDKMSLDIDFTDSPKSYGVFAKIDSIEFKRVMSNIINNAIESLPGGRGMVEIDLHLLHTNTVAITIKDNGTGIPKEVLNKAGTPGFTFGKPYGTGLGLSHAKATVEAWNGKVAIETSTEIGPDRGTKVTITLPKEEAPSWFVPELVLHQNTTVVIFDDDLSIHQIWNGRFVGNAKSLNVININTTHALRDFYRHEYLGHDHIIFLMDYEIIGSKETGLDLIEELGIAKDSILVTSRFEEPEILTRCEGLGVKLIPKPMAGFVPIV